MVLSLDRREDAARYLPTAHRNGQALRYRIVTWLVCNRQPETPKLQQASVASLANQYLYWKCFFEIPNIWMFIRTIGVLAYVQKRARVSGRGRRMPMRVSNIFNLQITWGRNTRCSLAGQHGTSAEQSFRCFPPYFISCCVLTN